MDLASRPAAAAGTITLGDLTVNRLGFGAMRVAGAYVWGRPRTSAAMLELLKRAFDLGHTFFVTADSYGPNVSEELIAEALQPYPRELVIATKGGWSVRAATGGTNAAARSICAARSMAA